MRLKKEIEYKDTKLLKWIYFPENNTNIPDGVMFMKTMTKKEVEKQYPKRKYIVK